MLNMNSMVDELKRNPICKVFFAGFESDTYTLRNHGWDFSVSQAPTFAKASNSYRLILRHPGANLYAYTNVVEIPYSSLMNREDIYKNLVFHITHVSSDIIVHTVDHSFDPFSFKPYNPIDAFCEPYNKEYSLKDLNIFKTIPIDTPEIVIPGESIDDLMERILKMQDKKASEIRERRRKERLRKEFSDSGETKYEDVKCQIIAI